MSNFINQGITNILGGGNVSDRSGPLGLPNGRRTVHVQRMVNRRRDVLDELHLVRQRRLRVECSLALPARVDEEPSPVVNEGNPWMPRHPASARNLEPAERHPDCIARLPLGGNISATSCFRPPRARSVEPGAALSHLERRRRFFFVLFFRDRLGGESRRAREARDSVS